jgi:hypothetical protein
MAGTWTQHLDVPSGHTYYFNPKTGVSSWLHPTLQASAEYESSNAQLLASGSNQALSTQTTTASELSGIDRCVLLLFAPLRFEAFTCGFCYRLKQQMAARLAKRKAGAANTTLRKLGGTKRGRMDGSALAAPKPGGDLQTVYKQTVQHLSASAPEAAKGTDGRGLVK